MSHRFSDYVVVIVLLILAIGLFSYMEREKCEESSESSGAIEGFINKNNVGTSYGRFETGIVQGGGGYPFVY